MNTDAMHDDDDVSEEPELDFSTFVSHEEVAHTLALLEAHRTDLATVAGIEQHELDALNARGLELLRAGMFHDAGRIFHGLIQLKPMEGRYYRNLGLSLHYEHQHTWARIVYGQALAFDPDDRIALALRAECTLVVVGKRDALPELERVVALGARNHREAPYVARAQSLLNKMTIYRAGDAP